MVWLQYHSGLTANARASAWSRFIEEFQILGFAERYWITGPGGAMLG
jgi:hypothetical protein